MLVKLGSVECRRDHAFRNGDSSFVDAAPTKRKGHLIALLRNQRPSMLKRREVLCREGDRASHLFLLIQGTLRLSRFFPNGRRLVAGFAFPGEMIGLSFADVYPYTLDAVADSVVCKMSRAGLAALVEHSSRLQAEVVEILKTDALAEQSELLSMMHQNAEERLARLLRMIAHRGGLNFKVGTTITLAMTRADIADYVGLTIETVSRSFSKLKEDGLISTGNCDEIRVENAEYLAKMAEGEF